MLDALIVLHEGNLYYELGYSRFHLYCDRELGLGHSTAYEYLRAWIAQTGLARPVDPAAKVRDAEALQHRLRELARTIPPAPRAAGAMTESTAVDYSPRTNGTLRAARESTAVCVQ